MINIIFIKILKKMFLPGVHLNSFLPSSTTASLKDCSFTKKKIKKFSTFDKKQKLKLINKTKTLDKIIKNYPLKKQHRELNIKIEKHSDNNLFKNKKFIRKLTGKNKPEDIYLSFYDTNRNNKKDKYYDEESLELIQKELQKRIKELKNDDKFLESYRTNDINTEELLPKEENDKNKKQEKKITKSKKFPFSAKNIIYKIKNLNNFNSEKEKNNEKLNNQSSVKKLSDDSSFLEDSKIENKNNENDVSMNKKKDLKRTKNINYKEKKYRILEIKKLVYDSFDDDEIMEDDLLNVNIIYISPDDIFIIIFDYVIILLTLYSLIFIPIIISSHICFKKFHFQNFLNYFMDIIYIIDLILSFFRPYYNIDDQLIFNNSKIIIHYLYSYFSIDLICSIPFYSIFQIFIEKDLNNCSKMNLSVKLDNLYRIFEILKALKLFKIMSKERNSGIKNLIKILENMNLLENYKFYFKIFVFLTALHIVICLNILVSRNSYPNWIHNNNLVENSFTSIYFISLYFIITTITTVGYGDITGQTLKEIIFQIFLLIVGIVSYSWLISNCSNIIHEKNKLTEKFNSKIRVLDDIRLNYSDMSEKMYIKIYRHLEYAHLNHRNNPKLLIDNLPYTLKNNLLNEMYKPIIKNLNFFKNFKNSSFVLEIVRKLLPIRAYKNDILLDQGDIVENMILVKEGRLSLEVKINIDNPEESVNQLLNDDIFMGNNTIINNNFNNIYKTIPFNVSKLSSRKILTYSLLNEEKKKINFLHLKILEIRKGENFGGFLVFLNRRTPLTLRVKTKKADLYYLKKIDAVEISSDYPNIWKRVNKISFHNLKQVSEYMKKIIKQYCNTYGINYKINSKKYVVNGIKNKTKVKFKLKKNEGIEGNNYKEDKKINNSINKGQKSKIKNINKNNQVEVEKKAKEVKEVKEFIKGKEKEENDNKLSLEKNSIKENNEQKNNYFLEKRKSKFHKMFINNSISNKEKSDIKDNNYELYLTPFSPKEINDEIYFGEDLVIKPMDLNIIINTNVSSTNINNIQTNLNTNSNINTHKNIKTKTNITLSMSRNSFSIININNTKTNYFNINEIKISKNDIFTISSIYENINKIAKYKYCKDRQFQSEVKKFIKKNYLEKKKNKKSVEMINHKFLNLNDKQLSLPNSIIPQIFSKQVKKKENLFPYHNSIVYTSHKHNPNERDNLFRIKISPSNEKESKRSLFRIRPSTTQVDKFYNKKNLRIKKKSTLLNEISNNINVLNHPNEFYAGLLNNIIKDRDKDNKKGRSKFSDFMPDVEIKRNSKTIKEQEPRFSQRNLSWT